MADGTQEWTEFTVPTAVLTQDTIDVPTAEYSDAAAVTEKVQAIIIA